MILSFLTFSLRCNLLFIHTLRNAKMLMSIDIFFFILGKGKPIELMMRNFQAVSLLKATIPDVGIAVEQYERSGGNLGKFGSDPLEELPHLIEIRENEFQSCNAQFN